MPKKSGQAKSCERCLLPRNYPGTELEDSDICSFCKDYAKVDLKRSEEQRSDREKDLENTLKECRGRGEYDCMVLLSGGKDSAYLLYKIKKEYGLRILAFTCDAGGYTGSVALNNIKTTLDKLDVDHIVFTPSGTFYKKLFAFLLKNQTKEGAVRTVCYVCHPLTEGYALDIAMAKGIPLILEGFSPGQPDEFIMMYEMPQRHIKEDSWLPKEIKNSGIFSDEELAHFWNPKKYNSDARFPRIIAPFHAWKYNQDEIMKKVVELGLIRKKKYADPVHSNCLMNWPMMYSDIKNLGYNSYIFEFAKLIREGKADKRRWSIMDKILKFMFRHHMFWGRRVKYMLKELGLQPEDLRIKGIDAKDITSHHQ